LVLIAANPKADLGLCDGLTIYDSCVLANAAEFEMKTRLVVTGIDSEGRFFQEDGVSPGYLDLGVFVDEEIQYWRFNRSG